ncbi:hypothetical protein EP18_08515 [Lysinibacillus sphaericus]|nr:DUF3953 domain-containing protein [Lysinibacillus sphaericus]KEK12641.1 hypothetical protein EP18_08515 [Lysinibacillus sphaericus]
MLITVQIILSIIGITLSIYGFMTHDYRLNFLMILFLGLFMLTLGINEFRRERKLYGWFLVGVFIFSVYVSSKRRIRIKS